MDTANDELHLAAQLLAGLDLSATNFTVRIAALVCEAGTLHGLEEARALRTEVRDTGITAAEALLDPGLAFHHAVQGEENKVRAVIDRLRELALSGDYAYYADIAHFMAGLRLPDGSRTRWLDHHEAVRARWQQLVQTRRNRIRDAI